MLALPSGKVKGGDAVAPAELRRYLEGTRSCQVAAGTSCPCCDQEGREPKENHGTYLALLEYWLPLTGAKMKFQASALTVFGVILTIPNSFGPPAVQVALALICVVTVALALIGGQRDNQQEPAKQRSENPNSRH